MVVGGEIATDGGTGTEDNDFPRPRKKDDAAIFCSMACRLFRILSKRFMNPNAKDDADDAFEPSLHCMYHP